MANTGLWKGVNIAAGTALAGSTQTATFDTEWLQLKGKKRFGFWIDLGTVSGTTPTWDIDLEFSGDGGTTVNTDFPIAVNSDTGGVMAQLTTTGDTDIKWFDNALPDNAQAVVRCEVTIGGTSPSFAIDKFILFTSED